MTIDLRDRTVTLHPSRGAEARFAFEVSEANRNRLLRGLDAIAETLLNGEAIRDHERSAPAWITPRPA